MWNLVFGWAWGFTTPFGFVKLFIDNAGHYLALRSQQIFLMNCWDSGCIVCMCIFACQSEMQSRTEADEHQKKNTVTRSCADTSPTARNKLQGFMEKWLSVCLICGFHLNTPLNVCTFKDTLCLSVMGKNQQFLLSVPHVKCVKGSRVSVEKY